MAERKVKTWAERKDAVMPGVKEALDNEDMDALMEALPHLQKRFAEEYIIDFNGSQAVQRCGSKTEHPEKMAYIWLNNPGVKAAIEHLTAERTRQMKIDQGYVIQKLIRTIESAESQSNHQAVLRGAELLAKHLGMFTEKFEHTGKDGGAIQYEKLNEDADAFTRAMSGLSKRAGEGDGTRKASH